MLIGDELTDLKSARTAGTRFLGYTRSEGRAAETRTRGSSWVAPRTNPSSTQQGCCGAATHLLASPS
ncbi:hypothetical protein ACFV0T_34925 [Streptomyces sp. NPDC059582]|uniref:hypothetical protein n=1 Tax=Streptomyces sp. NPDC059582 TaxID=3346875 RepID=UPI0036870C62